MRRAAASLPLAAVLLQVTVVAVLIPDIRLDLGSSTSGGQWMLNAYLLALAASYPLLAQLRGRAVTVAGALGMAAGAIVCARADSTAVLVVGQAVQGAGAAALLAPVAGPWTAVALPAAALALGPLAGGVFAEQNWWRVFFWAGIPIAAGAGLAALAAPLAERREPAPQLLAFMVGLTAITIAFVQAEPWGLGWAALAGLFGLISLSALPRKLSGWTFMCAVLAGCLAALVFLVPEYFQLVRNLSGLRSGILVLPVTLAAVTTWALSGWLAKRILAAALGLAGVACAAVGLAVLIAIDVDTRYAILIGALGLAGTGLGLASRAATRTEPPPLAPVLAGAALGLAAAGAALQLAQAHERESGASFEHALAAGVGWAAAVLLAQLAAGVFGVWQDRRAARPKPASSAAPPAAAS